LYGLERGLRFGQLDDIGDLDRAMRGNLPKAALAASSRPSFPSMLPAGLAPFQTLPRCARKVGTGGEPTFAEARVNG
jgi:hypothetical protein